MMRALRKKMAIFLWVMVGAFVAFIFLQWGMDITRRRSPHASLGTVARVNGEPIGYDYYRAFLNQYRRGELERLGVDRLDETEENAIEERAFDQLIRDVILSQEIRRRRVTVTDEEVLAFIRSNPPAQLLEDTTLFTDGKFDRDKYLVAVSDPRNLSWLKAYEREIRASLPSQKLQMDLLSMVRLTDGELRRTYDRQNQRVRVRYLFFNPEDHRKDISLTTEDLRAYYETNRDDFRQPEKVRLSYVIIEKTPSLEDELEVKEEIEELRRRAEEGEDFAELAREFSEDPGTAKEGGDLGYFGRGEMLKPIEEACFTLRIGQISPPLKTAFGWHLVKLEDKKGDKVRARHILIRAFASLHTLERIRERADSFLKDVRGGGAWEEVAKAYGVEPGETSLFARQGDFLPSIGSSRQGAKFAFEAKKGEVSDVVETPGGYAVLTIIERREPGVPPFEEISSDIHGALLEDRSRQLALDRAEAIAEEMRGGRDLKDVARSKSLPLHTPPSFSLSEDGPEVPWEPEFRGCSFALKQGEVSGVVETDIGFYIVELLERRPPDEETLKGEAKELAQALLNDKQATLLEDWFQILKTEAEVQDHRSDLR